MDKDKITSYHLAYIEKGGNSLVKESWEYFNIKDRNSDDVVTVVIVDKRFEPLFNKDHKESLRRNNVKVEGHYFNGTVVTGKVGDIIQVCDECHVMNPNKIFMEATTITEAPDDHGVLTDDELDAQYEQELAALQARAKARKDYAIRQREANALKDKEAQEQAAEEAERDASAIALGKEKLAEIDAADGDSDIEKFFNVLVPQSGKAGTVGGEYVRAMMKILYRDYNDGDVFYKGYGLETCGNAAKFLADNANLEDDFIKIAEDRLVEEEYTEAIDKIAQKLCDFLRENPKLLVTESNLDYLDEDGEDAWSEYEPRDFDYEVEISERIQKHMEKENIDIWDVKSKLEEMLSWESIFEDAEVDRPWGYSDSSLTVVNLKEEARDELENWDRGHLWDDYESELDDEFGDPYEEDDEPEDDEEEIEESLNEDEEVYDWYEDWENHPLVNAYDKAAENLGIEPEPSTQGRLGNVYFYDAQGNEVGRVDFEDEIDFMNSLGDRFVSQDLTEDECVKEIEEFIKDHFSKNSKKSKSKDEAVIIKNNILKKAPEKLAGKYVIPDTVTSIGYSAFGGCSSLTNIVIPKSVKSIGDFAFSHCSSLTSIVIPESVTSIGERAFFWCENLTIYCEASNQPSGWDSKWNSNGGTVVWGYKNNKTESLDKDLTEDTKLEDYDEDTEVSDIVEYVCWIDAEGDQGTTFEYSTFEAAKEACIENNYYSVEKQVRHYDENDDLIDDIETEEIWINPEYDPSYDPDQALEEDKSIDEISKQEVSEGSFTKEEAKQYAEEFYKYCFEKDESYFDIYDSIVKEDYVISCYIDTGDWKHDHLRFDNLAQEFFNEKNISIDIEVQQHEDEDDYG